MDPEKTQNLRRLSAIMFSDIVGYSQKMGADEQATLHLLKIHNEVMKRLIEANQGRIIKTAGDGVMASFDSAVNAVRCAAGIQREFREYNRKQPEQRQIWVRIGIHVGDVLIRDNDMFGDGVNIASRIEPLAEPGGICISQAVYQQIKNKIQLETVYLGPHDLKNIAEQIELYHLVLEAHDKQRLQSRQTSRMQKDTGKKPYMALAAAVALLFIASVFMLWQTFANDGKKTAKNTPPDSGANRSPKNEFESLALMPPMTRDLLSGLPEGDRGPFKDFNIHFFQTLEKQLEKKLNATVSGYDQFKVFLQNQGKNIDDLPQGRDESSELMKLYSNWAKTHTALKTGMRITRQLRARLQLEIDWVLWDMCQTPPMEVDHGSFSAPLEFPHLSAKELADDFSAELAKSLARYFKKK